MRPLRAGHAKIRPRPLKHATNRLGGLRKPSVQPRHQELRSPMTICIAALCSWLHGTKADGTPDFGMAVVTAADRMFTDAGLEIEYETGQGKWAAFGKRVIILVADSLPTQSEILGQLRGSIVDQENITAREVADLYSGLVLKYKREEAEKLFLAPYGMTMESFAESMQDNPNNLIMDLAQRVLEHSIGVEAIVAGVTAQGDGALYHVNGSGIITSHLDVGFVSIGSGHYHSNSFLTSRRYWNRWSYRDAVCAVYAAKRQAETAPGVGRQTDMILVNREGWDLVEAPMRDALEAEYAAYTKQLQKLESGMIKKVWGRVSKTHEKAQATVVVELSKATKSSTPHK